MHDSRKVFLLENEPRCITATYEEGDDAPVTEFKTFDPDIAVDDFVIVPTDTRHRMTVCKVRSVDVEPNLDTEAKMLWVIGSVDCSAYEKTLSSEGQFIGAARAAERIASIDTQPDLRI